MAGHVSIKELQIWTITNNIKNCRAKHFCAEWLNSDQQSGIVYNVLEIERDIQSLGLENEIIRNEFVNIPQYPGSRDIGTPMILERDIDMPLSEERHTIIGMFQEQLDENDRGPALFSMIDPDAFNWIVTYADWTQDSKCYSYTSCSCGI